MTRPNDDIRLAARRNGVRLWQVAYEMGIHDSALSRKMRKELPEEEKEQIFMIIEKLAKELYQV